MPALMGLGGGPEPSKEAFSGNKAENGEFGLVDVFYARYFE
jgi:hypothetical protein